MAAVNSEGTSKGVRLFATGAVTVSRSALEALTAAGLTPRLLIEKHVSGDFGLVEWRAARENLQAAQTGVRVLSRYGVGQDDEEVWIVTDKTRTRTMVFDPREYRVAIPRVSSEKKQRAASGR